MSEKMIAKEELIGILSEIHDQLEKLDNVLESNISSTRQNCQNEYAVKIANCGERIATLETRVAYFPEISSADDAKRNRPTSLKLELGY
ncbi:hypothetical protein BGM26_08690 [Bacillus sp. FJAT-29790]|uniref:hypothetical protein n=1 Tax=Bacillus sp. FJAT-29790 TaxID=1895002 RepID=UPI001C23EA82|nr:hypothetical protein [Bacillus sp. FJAT-29790]MBU8879059.1 hypothetical protein [Bacillus sp. FJAT-29790]